MASICLFFLVEIIRSRRNPEEDARVPPILWVAFLRRSVRASRSGFLLSDSLPPDLTRCSHLLPQGSRNQPTLKVSKSPRLS